MFGLTSSSSLLLSSSSSSSVWIAWWSNLHTGGRVGLTQFPMLDSLSSILPSPLSGQMIHLERQRNTLYFVIQPDTVRNVGDKNCFYCYFYCWTHSLLRAVSIPKTFVNFPSLDEFPEKRPLTSPPHRALPPSLG